MAIPSTACFFQALIMIWWTPVLGGQMRHRLPPQLPGRLLLQIFEASIRYGNANLSEDFKRVRDQPVSLEVQLL